MDSSTWNEYGKIDPELEAMLPHLPPSKPFTDYPDAPSLRKDFDRMMAEGIKAGVFQLPDMTGIAIKEIEIPVRDGANITALVYRSELGGPGPLIVYNHGGGFVFGSAENWSHNTKMAVEEFGAVVVSLNYRLAPEHIFPTAVNDGWDALKWVAQNAASIGADPSKGFVIAGTSAGGNIAAVAAHKAVDENLSPPLTGVYLSVPALVWNGEIPEEYRQHHRSHEQNKNARILDKANMEWFWKHYKNDPKSHLSSPLFWPSGHRGQPATYLQICGMDPLRDDSLIYEHLLKESGVSVRKDVYDGIPHAAPDLMPMLSKSKQAAQDLKAGLGWLLNQRA